MIHKKKSSAADDIQNRICENPHFLFDSAIPATYKFSACKTWLLKWSAVNLPSLRSMVFDSPYNPEKLTLIAYCFHADETRFSRVEFGILQTWRCIGKYPLTIVSDRMTDTILRFKSSHGDICKVIISPILEAGKPDSMNLDCIVNLHKYFTTPYCLIIQDDGFPIQSNIEEFLGKWDYIGAPFVRDKPWQFLADLLLINIENGGFCLRSKNVCSATSRRYEKLKMKLPERQLKLEDWFYCRIARKNIFHRLRYRFAPAKEARKFSFIDIEGTIDKSSLKTKPFGIHGPTTIWQFQDILSAEFNFKTVSMTEVLKNTSL